MERLNEFGVTVSVHTCWACGDEFTVCPPAGEDWGGCMAPNCPSYDPKRDADKLFEEEPWRVQRSGDRQ